MKGGTAMNAKITTEHLDRTAIVYVRQPTAGQVADHPESWRRQYGLVEVARELGFRSVETIDDDLGISGSGFSDRPGFKRLLNAVCSGAVGAVLALEASRLARNDRDWSQLVELGVISNVILIDHDGIYDPRAVNDRLLLGLKGIMSEFEMATLRLRAHEAVRAKARRGELRLCLPAGLVYGASGTIELDPDVRVQQAIRLAFHKFDELGSIRQALLWFRREGITLPVMRQGKGSNSVAWVIPNYDRVHAIITNPLYAGTYAFGRSESRKKIVDGRVRRTSGHCKPIERWEVLIQDHHPGYIDWQRYLRNVAILEENAYMKPATGRKSARGGRSLLSGLLRCRRCGHTLQVGYRGHGSTTPSFQCARRHHQTGHARCVSFTGKRVEDVVASQILKAVEGQAIEAALEAAYRIEEKHSEQRKALTLELEQARYEAQLAARRYERVDPDMRLVAGELESRWNAALERVSELEARIRAFDTRGERKHVVDERALRRLANDLPSLWNDDRTDMRLKQRVARVLIREIIADVDDASSEIVLVIHWQGGRHTEVRTAKSVNGRTQRCTDAQALELVRRMARGFSDHAIAAQLNRLGWYTGTGKHWTDARVRALRSRLELPAADPDSGHQMLTAKQAAQRLGISAQYLGLLLSRGVVPGTQIAPGTPWWIEERALISEEVQDALRDLRDRRLINRSGENRNLRIPGL
jgi:DNA invertase Pin-like site-specific DNA recombinase